MARGHSNGGPKPRPLTERFWEKVDRSGGPLACWPWLASRRKSGYGKFGIGSRTDGTKRVIEAPRMAWILTHGPIPEGLCVLHRCDNPPCVNVRHLFLGTIADNNSDRMVKGRSPKGADHWTHRQPERWLAIVRCTHGQIGLSRSQVAEIEKAVATGEQRKITAVRFGVHRQTVRMIAQGRHRFTSGMPK